MKVDDVQVPEDGLPQPASRVPNAIEDEEDRFDKAIAILNEMNEALQALQALHVLPEMNKAISVLPQMLDNQSTMLEILERIDDNTRHTNNSRT